MEEDMTTKAFREWMIKNWGKRCPDYNEECSLCRAWDCYDYLTKLGAYPLPPKKRNVTEVAKLIKSL
jgi:hypothetical protein